MLNRVALLAAGAFLALGAVSGAQSQTAPDHRPRTGQVAPATARPAAPAVATPVAPVHSGVTSVDPRLASPSNQIAPGVVHAPMGPMTMGRDARFDERRLEGRRGREWDRREGDRREGERDEGRQHRRLGWEEHGRRDHDRRRGEWDHEPRR